jgi:hypothetical protein
MKTPAGGQRDTQWVIQYREVQLGEKPGVDIPQEEKLWVRYAIAHGGPATRQVLMEMRDETNGLEWRAIRIETVQRVEDW